MDEARIAAILASAAETIQRARSFRSRLAYTRSSAMESRLHAREIRAQSRELRRALAP